MGILYQHDRVSRGKPLSASVRDALIASFCVEGVATPAAWATAQELLRFLRDSEAWLDCDCAADGSLISPRQTHSGQMTLVRHGRTPHAEACPFFRLRVPSELSVAPGDLPDELILDETDPQGMTDALRRIIKTCGFDTVRADELKALGTQVLASDLGQHYGRIDLAGEIRIDGKPLHERWVTHVRGLSSPRLHTGPGGTCLFVGIANEIDAELVRTQRDGKSFRFPQHGVQRRAPIEGPYWVLGRVDERGTAVGPGVAWPVMSGGLLLPVESERHRETARLLCRQLVYWREKHGLDVTLQVVLSPDGGAPDFWLRCGDQELAIDLVPMPGHGRSREEIAERVASRPGVSSFIRDDEDPDEWRRQLTGRVLRWK